MIVLRYPSTVTLVWVAIRIVTRVNGILRVLTGSHDLRPPFYFPECPVLIIVLLPSLLVPIGSARLFLLILCRSCAKACVWVFALLLPVAICLSLNSIRMLRLSTVGFILLISLFPSMMMCLGICGSVPGLVLCFLRTLKLSQGMMVHPIPFGEAFFEFISIVDHHHFGHLSGYFDPSVRLHCDGVVGLTFPDQRAPYAVRFPGSMCKLSFFLFSFYIYICL